jgi:hypothetical protein
MFTQALEGAMCDIEVAGTRNASLAHRLPTSGRRKDDGVF